MLLIDNIIMIINHLQVLVNFCRYLQIFSLHLKKIWQIDYKRPVNFFQVEGKNLQVPTKIYKYLLMIDNHNNIVNQ